MKTPHSLSQAGIDAMTEALTPNGWRRHGDLSDGDFVLAMDPVAKQICWKRVVQIVRREWDSAHDGPLIHWGHRSVGALTAPSHPWLQLNDMGRKRGDDRPHSWTTTEEVGGRDWVRLVFGGGAPQCFASSPSLSNEFVELLGWIVTEGCFPKPKSPGIWNHVLLNQSELVNPQKTGRIRSLAEHFRASGYTFNEYSMKSDGVVPFYIGADLGALIRTALPDKQLPPELICSLTFDQAQILYDALLDGDGHRRADGALCFLQVDQGRIDSFQMLAAMLGLRTAQKTWAALNGVQRITIYTRNYGTSGSNHPIPEKYAGIIWYPEFKRATAWLARRERTTFWTGSPAPTRASLPAQLSAMRPTWAVKQEALF
jgi:hypothetical protein